MKINSVCLSRTRFVIRGNFRQYIPIAGRQLSSCPVIDPSSYRSIDIYHLSSVEVRLTSSVYHQSSVYHFIFILHCHVYVGDWSTVAACWHRTCLALRWGVVTSAAAVCDVCRHPSPCSVAGTGLLVTTWCRLSPVFFHRRRGVSRFVDQCPVVAVLVHQCS